MEEINDSSGFDINKMAAEEVRGIQADLKKLEELLKEIEAAETNFRRARTETLHAAIWKVNTYFNRLQSLFERALLRARAQVIGELLKASDSPIDKELRQIKRVQEQVTKTVLAGFNPSIIIEKTAMRAKTLRDELSSRDDYVLFKKRIRVAESVLVPFRKLTNGFLKGASNSDLYNHLVQRGRIWAEKAQFVEHKVLLRGEELPSGADREVSAIQIVDETAYFAQLAAQSVWKAAIKPKSESRLTSDFTTLKIEELDSANTLRDFDSLRKVKFAVNGAKPSELSIKPSNVAKLSDEKYKPRGFGYVKELGYIVLRFAKVQNENKSWDYVIEILDRNDDQSRKSANITREPLFTGTLKKQLTFCHIRQHSDCSFLIAFQGTDFVHQYRFSRLTTVQLASKHTVQSLTKKSKDAHIFDFCYNPSRQRGVVTFFGELQPVIVNQNLVSLHRIPKVRSLHEARACLISRNGLVLVNDRANRVVDVFDLSARPLQCFEQTPFLGSGANAYSVVSSRGQLDGLRIGSWCAADSAKELLIVYQCESSDSSINFFRLSTRKPELIKVENTEDKEFTTCDDYKQRYYLKKQASFSELLHADDRVRMSSQQNLRMVELKNSLVFSDWENRSLKYVLLNASSSDWKLGQVKVIQRDVLVNGLCAVDDKLVCVLDGRRITVFQLQLQQEATHESVSAEELLACNVQIATGYASTDKLCQVFFDTQERQLLVSFANQRNVKSFVELEQNSLRFCPKKTYKFTYNVAYMHYNAANTAETAKHRIAALFVSCKSVVLFDSLFKTAVYLPVPKAVRWQPHRCLLHQDVCIVENFTLEKSPLGKSLYVYKVGSESALLGYIALDLVVNFWFVRNTCCLSAHGDSEKSDDSKQLEIVLCGFVDQSRGVYKMMLEHK